MNFPKYPIAQIKTPEGFKDAVGFNPVETYSTSYYWIIAIAGSEADISVLDHHTHKPVTHDHKHSPDLHHRHNHDEEPLKKTPLLFLGHQGLP